MSIAVDCPTCGTKLEAPDEAVGQQLPCPHCSATVWVPAGPPGTPAVRLSQHPNQLPQRYPPRPDYAEDRRDYYPDQFARADSGGSSAMSVTGLVLGIIGFALAFIPCVGWVLGILLGIMGAIFSGIGLSEPARPGQGKGMAVAGLILSILAIIWAPVFYFLVLASMAGAAGSLRMPG